GSNSFVPLTCQVAYFEEGPFHLTGGNVLRCCKKCRVSDPRKENLPTRSFRLPIQSCPAKGSGQNRRESAFRSLLQPGGGVERESVCAGSPSRFAQRLRRPVGRSRAARSCHPQTASRSASRRREAWDAERVRLPAATDFPSAHGMRSIPRYAGRRP